MVPDKWTIKELLNVTSEYLKKKEIDSPRLTAEVLLAHQLNRTRVKLYLNFDQPLSDREISGYRDLIRRRVDREPLQYITGIQEFWSMNFVVGPQVLVPRPESELLVEQALSIFKSQTPTRAGHPRILDLGTGSGVLAVSIAREIEGAALWASDISEEALVVARLNAKNHGVAERIDFRVGDLWEPFVGEDIAFDGIVSNPPYITSEAFDTLPPEVRDHEPRVALDGGEGGMHYIEKIIRTGPDYLNRDGWLLLEMDPEQTMKALSLMDETGRYGTVKRIKDYSHRYRVVVAQKKRGTKKERKMIGCVKARTIEK
jgi:release factor glutamine methyltransferase